MANGQTVQPLTCWLSKAFLPGDSRHSHHRGTCFDVFYDYGSGANRRTRSDSKVLEHLRTSPNQDSFPQDYAA